MQVIQRGDMRVATTTGGNCGEPVVLGPLAVLLALLGLNDANQSGGDHAAHVHEALIRTKSDSAER
jgi:hypothetical protein